MGEVKYIVTYHERKETMLVFPSHVRHDDFAKRMGLHNTAIVSAGFLMFVVDDGRLNIDAFGWAESLGGISARLREDKAIAEKMFYVDEA